MKELIMIFVLIILNSCSHEPMKSFDDYLDNARFVVDSNEAILNQLFINNYFNKDSSYRVTSIEIFTTNKDTICSLHIQSTDAPEGSVVDFYYVNLLNRISGLKSALPSNMGFKNVDSLFFSYGFEPEYLYYIVYSIVNNGFEGYIEENTFKQIKEPMIILKQPNYMIFKSDSTFKSNTNKSPDSRIENISNCYYLYYCSFLD